MFSALKPHNYSGFNQENVRLIEHNCVLGPAQVNSSGKRRGRERGLGRRKRKARDWWGRSKFDKQEGDQESKRKKLQSNLLAS